jgi:hypothetical protein
MYNKAMADWLVAGCHSDEAISENKGPPVMTQSERCITQHPAARMFFFSSLYQENSTNPEITFRI